MRCPNCNNSLDEGAVFCGICGTPVSPSVQGATVIENSGSYAETEARPMPGSVPYGQQSMPMQQQQPTMQSPQYNNAPPAQQTSYGGPYSPPPMTSASPYTPPVIPQAPTPGGRANGSLRAIFIAASLVLLVVIVGGGIFVFMSRGGNNPQAGGVPTGTSATFSFKDDAQGKVNGITVESTTLPAPPAGKEYQAWILNNDESFVALGPLKQNGKTFTADFPGKKGVTLLDKAIGAKITVEQPGQHSSPSPSSVLSASFPSGTPDKYFTHIKHLLFQFGTPHNLGLMVGLRDQATILNSQAGLLKNVNSQFAERCVLWSLIDIIEGTKSPNFVNLQNKGCASVGITQSGDGLGILGKSMGQAQDGYAGLAAAHASLAASQSDSTGNTKTHQPHVQAAIDDTIEWGTKVDQDAQALLNALGNHGKINELVQLAGQVLNGVTAAGQEAPRPIKGEAGVLTDYQHTLLMAAVDLTSK